MYKLLLALLLLPTFALAEDIRTIPKNDTNYYVWLTQLSVGPYQERQLTEKEYEELPSDEERGFKYRAAITTSDIYSGLYVEKITEGMEGCCLKFKSIYKVDLQHFSKVFDLIGEVSGLEILHWLSPTKFVFTIHGRRFEASAIVQNDTIKMQEIKGS